jgi:hypothetical protein
MMAAEIKQKVATQPQQRDNNRLTGNQVKQGTRIQQSGCCQ